LAHIERALQVYADDFVPFFLGQLMQHGIARDPGIVHEDIHAAECLFHFIDERVRFGRIRNVMGRNECAPSEFLDFRGGFPGRFGGDVVHDDMGALPSHSEHGRGA